MPPFKPYTSKAQERFFNSSAAKEKGIKPMDIAGKNSASKGMKLPDKVAPKRNFKIKIRKKHFAKKSSSPQMGSPMAPPMGMA